MDINKDLAKMFPHLTTKKSDGLTAMAQGRPYKVVVRKGKRPTYKDCK